MNHKCYGEVFYRLTDSEPDFIAYSTSFIVRSPDIKLIYCFLAGFFPAVSEVYMDIVLDGVEAAAPTGELFDVCQTACGGVGG